MGILFGCVDVKAMVFNPDCVRHETVDAIESEFIEDALNKIFLAR
ncbi:MAG: hypothetical protein Q7S46_13655 [Gallionella sp.]|nr:hypothetical protein [Gallionella sp.]